MDDDPTRHFVRTDEADVDIDDTVAFFRRVAGADGVGVRPHPDHVAAVHAYLDQLRGRMDEDELVEFEKLLDVSMQVHAIYAAGGYPEFRIID